jgi:lysophospholipase L1-like esterase
VSATRGGNVARAALLLALSGIASLALAECSVRALWPQPLGFSYLNEDGFILHVPNREGEYRRDDFRARVRINSTGFRGDEFAIPKPAGTFRIVALGDSFAEGMQVHDEETFAALLEASLTTPERPVEVANLGVSGYGTSQELALLRVFGPRLEPDLVIVFFCLANDVRNNLQSDLCRWQDGRLECRLPERPSPRRLALAHLRGQIATRSHLFQLLRAATASPVFQQIGVRAPVPPESTPEMPFGIDLYRATPPAYLADGLALTRETLRELAARAADLGAETWLVLLPIREQIWDRKWNELAATAPEPPLRDGPQRPLRAIAAEIGMPVVDLYQAFRDHNGAGETLYWPIDGHFDAAGHALTAREVADALRAQGLPGAP